MAWVANAFGRSVTHLCGARLENCPPGAQTGDPISPPGGYVGGLQIITDVAIDPAGNVWVANNWDCPDEGFKKVPDPALSTRFGGNAAVVFFGLAKPVKTPLIGPPARPSHLLRVVTGAYSVEPLGYDYVHTAIDEHTRMAYAGALPHEKE